MSDKNFTEPAIFIIFSSELENDDDQITIKKRDPFLKINFLHSNTVVH